MCVVPDRMSYAADRIESACAQNMRRGATLEAHRCSVRPKGGLTDRRQYTQAGMRFKVSNFAEACDGNS